MDLVLECEGEGSRETVFPRAFLLVLLSEGIQKLMLCEGCHYSSGVKPQLQCGSRPTLYMSLHEEEGAFVGRALCSILLRSPSPPLVQCEDYGLAHEGNRSAPLLL